MDKRTFKKEITKRIEGDGLKIIDFKIDSYDYKEKTGINNATILSIKDHEIYRHTAYNDKFGKITLKFEGTLE